ncbi:MAG: 16S rRNA (uracil(1498)-N(3))-methyltransferase [Treponema sp.]|nr:16S rRNA (uracil(1498)-N(3))-methyltransferase [Treponema sp.]
MKRFVLSAPPNPEGMVRLYDKDYHYLVRVRRLGPGSCFDAILPSGGEVRLRVLSTVDNILIGECLDLPDKPPSPIPPIALFQALPKGAKMDTIVRQAGEGGVSVIAPFESEYSAAHPGTEKLKRWQRIIREARQQSGSATETVVRPPCGFAAALEYWESLKKAYERPVGIALHQEPLEKGGFHDYIGYNPDFVALAVGPEGGFSPREVSLFLAAGFKPVLMGNTILRVETAALYGTAALRIILLESESWILKG